MDCVFDPDGRDTYRIHLQGVESYKATYLWACTVQMCDAYDRVVDAGATTWLSEVSGELLKRGADVSGLQHLMIYFDDGPCYEFICRSFSAERIAGTATNG